MGPSNPRQLCCKTYCVNDDFTTIRDDEDVASYTKGTNADVVDGSGLLCKGRDTAMHIIKKAINSRIHNSVVGACWALSLMSETNDIIDCQISDIIASGIAPKLIDLIRYKDNDIIEPTIRTIGNIIMHSDNATTQVLINLELIEHLIYLLKYNSSRKIKNEVCFIISNIACEGSDQCHALIDKGAISSIISIIDDIIAPEVDGNIDNICLDILYTLSYISCFQIHEQIKYLLDKDTVVLMCSILTIIDNSYHRATDIILDIITNIIKTCQDGKHKRLLHSVYLQVTLDDSLHIFNSLRQSTNLIIANKANVIYCFQN